MYRRGVRVRLPPTIAARTWTIRTVTCALLLLCLSGLLLESDADNNGLQFGADDRGDNSVAQDEYPTLQPDEAIPRTGTVTIDAIASKNVIRATWHFDVTLSRSDTLVSQIQDRDVTAADLADAFFGSSEPSLDDFPTMRQSSESTLVTVEFSGTNEFSDSEPYIILFAGPSSTGDTSLTSVGLAVKCRGCVIIRSSGMTAKVEQTSNSIDLWGSPTYSYVQLRSNSEAVQSSATDDSPIDLSDLYFVLIEVIPWLVIAIGLRGEPRPGLRLIREFAFVTILLIATVAALGLWSYFTYEPVPLIGGVVFFGFPFAVSTWANRRFPAYRSTIGTLVSVLSPAAVLCSMVAFAAAGVLHDASWAALFALISTVCCLLASLIWWRDKRLVLQSTIAAAGMALVAAFATVATSIESEYSITIFELAAGIFWLPVALVTGKMIRGDAVRKSFGRLLGLTFGVVGLSLLLPVMEIARHPSELVRDSSIFVSSDEYLIVSDGLIALNLALAAVLLLDLLRHGKQARDSLTAESRILAISLATIAVTPRGISSGWALIASAAATATFAWLLPRSALPRARRLGSISRAAHQRLVMAESRRRLVIALSSAHFRDLRKHGAVQPDSLQRRWRDQAALDSESKDSTTFTSIRLSEAALASAAGYDSATNGRAAAAIGAALSIPIVAYEAYVMSNFVNWSYWTVDWMVTVAFLAHWVAFAFIFGYFYPLIRGRSPMAKAIALLGALAIPETSAAVIDYMGVWSLLAEIGQLVVFCLGLGLAWEWRAVRSAGLFWARIRDARSVRSVSAPLATLLIAVATATATAIVGAAAAVAFAPHTTPPAPSAPDKSPASSASP